MSKAEPPPEDPVSAAARAMQAARRTHGGGRPMIAERCPCGRYSKALAAKRGHQCTAPAPKKRAKNAKS